MRIQFYPSPNLEQKLTEESIKLGVHISILVNDILNKHYDLIPPNGLNDVEIEKRVFREFGEYIKNLPLGKEFSLLDASPTFRQIKMVYDGKPRALRARIGKKFAQMVGTPDFPNVEQVFIEPKNPNDERRPKRTVGTRAALYKKKNG